MKYFSKLVLKSFGQKTKNSQNHKDLMREISRPEPPKPRPRLQKKVLKTVLTPRLVLRTTSLVLRTTETKFWFGRFV